MSILPRHGLFISTIVLSLLTPLISFAQVTIKERVEIKPKDASKNQSMGKPRVHLNASSGDYFDPPLFAGGGITLGEAIAATGQIEIQGAIDGNQEAVLTVQLNPYQDRPIAWKGRQPIPWGGNMYEGNTTYYDTVGGGSGVPDIQLYRFIGDRWGVNGTRETSISALGDRVNYSFGGVLYQSGAPIVKIVATATVTGSFLPNVKFDHWNMNASDMTVFGRDSIYVSCNPVDGKGGEYAPAGMDQAKVDVSLTWQVSASGDYEYLSYIRTVLDDHWNSTYTYFAGQQLTTPLWSGVYVVYDKSKGTFNGQSDTVYVTVSGGGKSKTVPVILTKGVPCDRVTITPSWVIPGDSAAISIKKNNGDGTFSEYPVGQPFDAMIVEAGNMGMLVSPEGSGTVLSGVIAPLKYVAPKTFDGSYLNVHLAVSAQNSTGVSSSAVAAQSSNLAEEQTSKLRAKSLGTSPRESVVASLGKMLAESTCPPVGISVEKIVCNRLTINPPTLLPGGTAAITFFIDNGDGTTSDFPADETFNILVWKYGAEGDLGTVVASNGSGSHVTGAIPPITYHAPSTIEGDSLEVFIFFIPSSEGEDFEMADLASGVKNPTPWSKKLNSTAGESKKMSKQSLQEAIGKSLAQSTCGPGKIELKKARVPDDMTLTVDPSQVGTPGVASLKATLTREGKDIASDEITAKVDFSMGIEGQDYGNLKMNGQENMTLPDVDYGMAVGRKVLASFSKIDYRGLFPLAISVKATGKSDAFRFTRHATVTLSGPWTKGVRYLQGSEPWGTKPYDSSGENIGRKGCALTCMAMIAKARGVDLNPLSLNTYMSDPAKGKYRFTTDHGVMWPAIKYYGDEQAGLGRIETFPKKQGDTISPLDIEGLLAQGAFVVAQVINPHTGNHHFILITGKIGNDLSVLDPDGDPDDQQKPRSTKFSDYKSGALSLVVYRPK